MKKAVIERNLAGILFIAVLVAFSLAQRDSKKLDRLYTQVIEAGTQLHVAKTAVVPAPSH